jgi:hypothetical protein
MDINLRSARDFLGAYACEERLSRQLEGKIDQEKLLAVQAFPSPSVRVSDPLPVPSTSLVLAYVPAATATPLSEASPPKVARTSHAGPGNKSGMWIAVPSMVPATGSEPAITLWPL